MTNEEIESYLFSKQDIKFKDFNDKIVNSSIKSIGVRVPIVKELAKQIASGNFRDYLKSPNHNYAEENLLHGCVVAVSKMPIDEKLNYLDEWLPYIDSWGTCDCTFCECKDFAKNKEVVWTYLLKLLNNNNLFAVRFALGSMFCYFKNDDYIDRVLDVYIGQTSDDYYIKMVIAWGMATLMISHFEKCVDILKNKKLPAWTHNKLIQKARESFRISNEQKKLLLSLKI